MNHSRRLRHRARTVGTAPFARWRARRDPRVTAGEIGEGNDVDTTEAELGVSMDSATVGRLQQMADDSRGRVEELLASSGYPSGEARPARVDSHRELDAMVGRDMECLIRIEELHEQRRSSPSASARRHAARVLTEVLDRIVDGYEPVADTHWPLVRPIAGVDAAVSRGYQRLSLFGRRLARADWVRRATRLTMLGLAFGAAGSLAAGNTAWAALAVAVRVVLSLVSTPPPPPRTRGGRLPRNPDWLGGALLNIGDVAIVAGTAAWLQHDGRTMWAALAAACGLFGLSATYVRVAAQQTGIPLSRLSIDRAAKDVTLTGAAVAAGIAPSIDLWRGVPVLAVPALAVVVMGVVELGRVVYETARYDRRSRMVGSQDGELTVERAAFTTDDHLVYQIPLAARRQRLVDPEAAAASRPPDHAGRRARLRVIHGGSRRVG